MNNEPQRFAAPDGTEMVVLRAADYERLRALAEDGEDVVLALAAEAAKKLAGEGIKAAVVSMPSMELFAAQDEAYRRKVLPPGPVRVAVEAGVRMGWDRWLLGQGGREAKAGFVGMKSFGASAPDKALYEHFGITVDAVVSAAKEHPSLGLSAHEAEAAERRMVAQAASRPPEHARAHAHDRNQDREF